MSIKNIREYNWEKIITRPFNLFGASVRNEWYASELTKEILGEKTSKGLFIEHPKGIVRHYRTKEEINKVKNIIKQTLEINPKKYNLLLKEAKKINKKAKQILNNNPFTSLNQAIDFLNRLALLSVILPYTLGELTSNNRFFKKIMFISIGLRGVSIYPKMIKQIVYPMLEEELAKLGVRDKEAVGLITYKELLKKDTKSVKKRLEEVKIGKNFIYQNIDGEEEIVWTNNPEQIIREIESEPQSIKTELKGNIAYKGKVTGKARVVFVEEAKGIKFDKGDILVAISTNPGLAPFFKKAAAIVTDEGGIMSHAAIVSRELAIPAIIGTNFATSLIKTGDLVEVDAEKGIVRIIKNRKTS